MVLIMKLCRMLRIHNIIIMIIINNTIIIIVIIIIIIIIVVVVVNIAPHLNVVLVMQFDQIPYNGHVV